jgi:hypothetical protein
MMRTASLVSELSGSMTEPINGYRQRMKINAIEMGEVMNREILKCRKY